jgi:predicted nucleic acid-binding protein
VLAGAGDERHVRELQALLARAELLPCTASDYLEAATLFRLRRQQGEAVRKLIDCLIAAVAIRAGVPLLHHNSDYDALARHSPLSIHAANT